jgi:hypothetical protein
MSCTIQGVPEECRLLTKGWIQRKNSFKDNACLGKTRIVGSYVKLATLWNTNEGITAAVLMLLC